MKITHILATAGLALASLGVTTAASAKDHHNDRGYQDVRYDRHARDDHRDWHGRDRDGRYGRYDRHDNGRHYGWRNGRGHNRCHTEWRHHRQIRVCR
ncbi:hypothetical protein SPAN111604_09870 [Sphingomonas antarctica]